jgi:UDP-N-acetylglucosamine 2-epimerase (non-hydrolysing)
VILVVFGTTGELIKLAPVLLQLNARGHRYLLATTGQQVQQIPVFLEQFGLGMPDLWLARGAADRDLGSNVDIPGWLATAARTFARNRGRLRRALTRGPGRPLVLVHGDTMTTVLGAAMGRTLRVPVAHIESGLRSFDLLHPFPEELNRRLTSRMASIHYAPGRWAASNLRRPDVVDTGSNTIRDSLALVGDGPLPLLVPGSVFGVVSLHRFELLNNRALLSRTLELLRETAERTPLLFVDHSVTAAAISRFSLHDLFDLRFVRVPRLRFYDFVRVERHSAFVVTDSGGSQEECFYLDKPCLVHRRRTERREGLGENVVLSRLDDEVVRDFLRSPERFRRHTRLPDASPTTVIVDDLERRRIAAGGR